VQGTDEDQWAEVLVVGSGIAGLTFALKAAQWAEVRVVTKKFRADSATNYARGGLAAIMAADDRPELHIRDTEVAGAGLCHADAVDAVVREGPARVMELMEWGVGFHREGAGFSLGREGGHSRRRILHAGDRTGREIERALLDAVAAHPRIQLVENLFVVDLLIEESVGGGRRRCRGALAVEHRTGKRVRLLAGSTLLATGGVGQVFQHTTNPSIATGDGVAMAYRAGATVSNMEFIQFHPTALYPTEDPAFLLSEALRGEGALLRRPDGTSFMELYHPDGPLAPRDVVARAILQELRKSGEEFVYLDVSSIPRALLESRFPGAVHGCRARGIDLFGRGVPVVPAAHYSCGGVRSDLEGRTDLEGLYVAGEVACTGTHGANRLASNSLLEAVVFSHRAAECIRSTPPPTGAWGPARVPNPESVSADGGSEESLAELRTRLRSRMWEEAGIVRTDQGLERVREEVESLRGGILRRWVGEPWSEEMAELRNLLDSAALILAGAVWRKESRGLHHNLDHPMPDDERFRRDSLVRGGGPPVAQPEGGRIDPEPSATQEGRTTIFPKT